MNWTAAYIGIPYVAGGRSRDGADCYGLVRIVERDIFGVILPELGGYEHATREEKSAFIAEHLSLLHGIPVDAPLPGDVVLLRICGVPCHLGVYVGQKHFLHTLYPHDSALERTDSLKWCKRIEGYYRVS